MSGFSGGGKRGEKGKERAKSVSMSMSVAILSLPTESHGRVIKNSI